MTEREFDLNMERARLCCFRMIWKFCRCREDVEDVWQEACIRAWKSRGKYVGERGDFRAWMLAIARNSAIDHMRAADPVCASIEVLAEVESGRSVEADVIAGDSAQRLLDRLSDRERTILLGRLRGESFREVGLRIGSERGAAWKMWAVIARIYREMMAEADERSGREGCDLSELPVVADPASPPD